MDQQKPNSGSYTQKGPDRPISRYAAVFELVTRNEILLFGGFTNAPKPNSEQREQQGRLLNDIWTYDMDRNEWRFIQKSVEHTNYHDEASTPGLRHVPGNAVSDDSLYIFGGVGGEDDRNDLWRYGIDERSWTQIHPDGTKNEVPPQKGTRPSWQRSTVPCTFSAEGPRSTPKITFLTFGGSISQTSLGTKFTDT